MTKRTLFSTIGLLAMLVAGCRKDPQASAQEYFAKGEQHLANRKVAEAIIEYRRAVQADPRLGKARLRLADAYIESGDGANALREYLRAAELLPDDNDAQLKAGNYLLAAGRYQDAQGLGERMLARTPSNVDAQILVANALAGLKDTNGAATAYEKAIDMDPSRADAYASLGTVELVRGDRAKAEAAYNKAIEMNPKSVRAHLARGNYKWAAGDAAAAEADFRKAIEIDGKNLVANRALASLFLATRRADQAEPLLRTLADASPGHEAKLVLADFYLRTGKPEAAHAVLTPLTNDKDAFVGATVRLAKIEAANKNLTEAKRLLESALAREPHDLDALITRARVLLAEGNSINALSSLKTAAESNPRSVDARLGLAQTYAMRGEVKEAITAFNEVLSLDAGNALARLGLAEVQINNGMAADAVPLLLKVVQEYPGSLAARHAFFQGLMAVGDLPQAANQLAAMQKISPDSPIVQNATGMLAAAKQDQNGARSAYARALAADPRSYQALAGLLTAEMQSKNFGAAKELIEKQLAKMPNDPNVLLMAAQTFDALGDAVETERALKKTVEADPQSLQGYAMLGKLYYEQGRLDAARMELEKYVATAPMSVPGNTMLGTILDMQGKTAEAKQRYGKALQIDPRAAVAANNLAWINANGNESLDVALQLAQTAKSQLPSRHEIDDTLGWIYYRKGLYSMAVDSLRNSTLKQPDNAAYNYHLALALQKNGNTAEARKLLEKAVASKQNFDGVDDAKRLLAEMKGTN